MDPQTPTAVTKAYDILRWLVPHVGKFPRSQRFILGDRLENKMLTVLELLICAAYTRDKKDCLAKANIELQIVQTLVRLAKDLGLTSVKQYEYISGELVGLGRQVGGWGKAIAQG